VFADVYEGKRYHGKQFSRHIGYVSLLPLMFGFVEPGSKKLYKLLDIIEDQ